MRKAVSKPVSSQHSGKWTVYAGGRPIAYDLTAAEQKRVKRLAERRAKRFKGKQNGDR